jgi:hypothetical protein
LARKTKQRLFGKFAKNGLKVISLIEEKMRKKVQMDERLLFVFLLGIAHGRGS